MSEVSRWRDSGHLERAVETAGGPQPCAGTVRSGKPPSSLAGISDVLAAARSVVPAQAQADLIAQLVCR